MSESNGRWVGMNREEYLVYLGMRIRKARAKSKLKQSQLAEGVGVHVNTLSGWERGVAVPDAFELKELERILSPKTAEAQS